MTTPYKRPRGPVLSVRLDARPTRTNEVDLPMNIGRFFILRRLGSGGMSQVLLGYDEDLDRKLAIKLLHRRVAAQYRDRMVREAQALAQLSHPNVVQIYEVGEYGASLYLAMEFVQGVTLYKWVEGRRIDEILEIYLQAGRGLAAAHRAGLFHRDFKPANAMVGRDGRVRVMDFGLVRGEADARDTEEHTAVRAVDTPLWAVMTHDGIAAGTPAYMAPEQCRATVVPDYLQ
jgi:serine/threonine protein kinase